jgi:putative endonuclease
MGGWVYIMASRPRGTVYVGVTSDISGRVWEHREGVVPGFTAKYGVKRLVWYREYDDIRDAIADEKRIKKWRRVWKLKMIDQFNPRWRDLFTEIAR